MRRGTRFARVHGAILFDPPQPERYPLGGGPYFIAPTPVNIPSHWSENSRRVGIASAWAVCAVGISYVAVIVLWVIRERSPREPIADPYLAIMELLTIASALALLGLVVALSLFVSAAHRFEVRVALALGSVAAGLTMAVHFVQLTAVRQLWRAGRLDEYRLVWPSPLFAVEYFVWDVLVGLTMVFAGLALTSMPAAMRARTAFLLGGTFCILGVAGPVTGQMAAQNVAVLGYAVILPIAAALTVRIFRAVPADDAAA